jgi:1-acyl-sn-glycerol-3-phosphate acyltransferase
MNFSYWVGWSFFRLVFATYFRCRFCNTERVPLHGPIILAANHASYLDPPLIGSGLKRMINYLARENLFRFSVVKSVLLSWQVVPVDRDGGGAAGLRRILDRLLEGGAIILFPEGTRSRNGCLQSARSGVGLTVIKSTAPVIPVRVFGTFDAYGPHLRFPRPRALVVKYGEPLGFEKLRAEAKFCAKPRLKEIYQQVANEIMEAIATLQPCEDKTTFP